MVTTNAKNMHKQNKNYTDTSTGHRKFSPKHKGTGKENE
jgi:hypothetical protein